MARNRRALLVAALCVLAVSLAAATLANPQQPAAGSGVGGGGPDQTGTDVQSGDDGSSSLGSPDRGQGILLDLPCVQLLATPAASLLVAGVALLVGFVAYRRDGFVPGFAAAFVTAALLVPVWLLLTNCGHDPSTNRGGGALSPLPVGPAPGGDASGSAGSELLFSPPAVLLGLLAVAAVLGAVAFRATGDDDPPDRDPVPEPADGEDEETLDALGSVAGDAADRIAGDADVENEVYRAWREMTEHLDVDNPEASTPAEFAAAASDAGMAREHVDELTDLFRSVRYGGAEVTAEREQRAVDALRAVEASYGGEG
ncbi:DUF4129 domain-containing protein [Halobacterium hubeiense]|uniref:DUF4129 domain-containing protein n=1 Tax=Halobacterium hubeiense TaxID=1407499 RepID=UPI003C72D487